MGINTKGNLISILYVFNVTLAIAFPMGVYYLPSFKELPWLTVLATNSLS